MLSKILKSPLTYSILFLIFLFCLIERRASNQLNVIPTELEKRHSTNSKESKTQDLKRQIINNELKRSESNRKIITNKISKIQKIMTSQTLPQLKELSNSYEDLLDVTNIFVKANSSEIVTIQEEFTNVFSQLDSNNSLVRDSNDSIRSVIGDINLHENSNFRFLEQYLSNLTNPFLQLLIQVGNSQTDSNGRPIILMHNALIVAKNESERIKIRDYVKRWHSETKHNIDRFYEVVEKMKKISN